MFPSWSLVFGVAFGAAIGSFLNVLIYRLPRGLSILFPPSHCPACQHRLSVHDLIPLLSYLWQRGRCRYCRAPIPPRYFWVELWSASVWGWLWWQYLVLGELPLRFLFYALACSILIAIFFIDLEHTIIPDELNLALLGIGLLHAWFVPHSTDWSWAHPGVVSLRNAFWSAEIGTGILCAIAILGRVVFRRDAMGHGDIKLVRAMGALLLLPALLTAFALAVAGGAVIGGLWLLWQSRQQPAEITPDKHEPPAPEPIGSLLLMCLVYLIWLDVLLNLLPIRWRERVYARLGQLSEEVEEELVELPGMLPFGPFLAVGAQLMLLFGAPFAQAIQAYLRWSGF
ncbi:Leader peptidase PppA [bacterium HR15]|uniref:Peptidase A24A domain protein n=1 Tax=uncultured prokaryote TaxID=198431 RepID=H5SN76_9ZZZZ|nr:peptidase A24A domain protein [uncultured prokaryote]GBC91659.1 Leader peptidase PppA [bacterium HR15]